jgi:outer membrane protein OmpA-like peptidoglycan-associated protein
MANSTPRWDAIGSGQTIRTTTSAWDLRWWIMAAVVTSIVVHAGLFVLMKRYKLEALVGPERPEVIPQTGTFEVDIEQLSIPENLLRDLTPEAANLEQKNLLDNAVKDVPDISEIAEAVKNQDLTLTSTIKDMAANLTLSKPSPGTAGDLMDDLADVRTSISDDLSKSILSAPSSVKANLVKPDDDQLLIDPAASMGGTDLKADLLQSTKKGTGGNGGLEGFTNLDDLVNYKGPALGNFKTMLRTDLLFDFGSASLRDGARLSLMKLGIIMQSNPKATFRFVGHTDSIGDETSNQSLSEARAQVVKDWLVTSLRLNPAQIVVEGAGERELVAPSAGTVEEQALNRRVEIHKTGGPQ